MFPAAGQGFLAGLRGALGETSMACELMAEPVGACADKAPVLDRIQRLLLTQSPDVVTGIIGSGLLPYAHVPFLDARVPFIVNDMGADPLTTGGARNAYVFSNSLHLWQSMYALGYWAARNIGTRACVATGFHDAGYGIIHAFWLGFCEAGGGEVLATEVTHRETPDDDPTDQLRRLASFDPDLVMAFYAGREGVSFANAWSSLGLAGRIPLLVSPLMFHEYWRPAMAADTIAGARTAFSWDMTAHTDALEQFRRRAGVEAGTEPAVFTLLGYETGRMLAAAAACTGAERVSAAAMREALSGVEISSPRGELRIDRETGEVDADPYLFEWRRSAQGVWTSVNAGALERPASCRAAYEAIQASETRSGWFNPYLVT
jgi:branched-chain amino acid transport system substrate-binding protein